MASLKNYLPRNLVYRPEELFISLYPLYFIILVAKTATTTYKYTNREHALSSGTFQ